MNIGGTYMCTSNICAIWIWEEEKIGTEKNIWKNNGLNYTTFDKK